MEQSEQEAQGFTTPFRLVILGDGSVRTIPLVGERWVIGRSPECEIPLRDLTVSRKHVLLERCADSFTFKDLGGRNPILVDGKPSDGSRLEPGQTLAIGLTRILLESRGKPTPIARNEETVFITGREVIDEGLHEASDDSMASRARSILERIEWTFADLGALADAAEPLLALALNLTGRQRGMIGEFLPSGIPSAGGLEVMATLNATAETGSFSVPESVLREGRQLKQVSILTTTAGSESQSRLVAPLGPGPDAILVLDTPAAGAPEGQELLRLTHTLGQVIWHRLFEVRERQRLRAEVQRLRFQGTTAHNAVLASTRLQGPRQALRELAKTSDPVLLVGEEGTEQEDLARYLHAEGKGNGAFASLHLGMIAEWRYEAALFGDGQREPGALSKAASGTLFVHNITLLPPPLQERLANEMQPRRNGEVPAGDTVTPARVIAAAETAPVGDATGDATADGTADAPGWQPALAQLFLTHVIKIPPLRDEVGDITALAELFLSEMGSGPDGSPRLLSERARRVLKAYPWPGNTRQLRQVLESAAAMAGTSQILPRHLPAEIAEPGEDNTTAGLVSLEEVERRHIQATLKRLGGNRARSAQSLGIATSTLYEKLRRFNIDG